MINSKWWYRERAHRRIQVFGKGRTGRREGQERETNRLPLLPISSLKLSTISSSMSERGILTSDTLKSTPEANVISILIFNIIYKQLVWSSTVLIVKRKSPKTIVLGKYNASKKDNYDLANINWSCSKYLMVLESMSWAEIRRCMAHFNSREQ